MGGGFTVGQVQGFKGLIVGYSVLVVKVIVFLLTQHKYNIVQWC